jgi:formylglycine-generating enzyme required for sulfatase activity
VAEPFSIRRFVMKNYAIWCVAVLVLTIGFGRQAAADPPPQAKAIALDLGRGVKLDLILIPAGEFKMGSDNSEKDAPNDEKPQHRVRITKPFYMGKYLVTQEQWEVIMGGNPSHFPGPKNPVEQVSWEDCREFVERLNRKVTGGKFALPTEAQWEYACRAGSTTKYFYGDEESGLDKYAWYSVNSGNKTHPVGEKTPNAWGLYDMTGNVCEWCADWYDDGYYAHSPTDDPRGPDTGSHRVLRGGGWNLPAGFFRSAGRFNFSPGLRLILGFRVCIILADK